MTTSIPNLTLVMEQPAPADDAPPDIAAALDRVAGYVREAESQAKRAAQEIAELRRELAAVRAERERERAKAYRQAARAEQILSELKTVHRSLFTGNVYSAVLRATMALTQATRGVFLRTTGQGAFEVRAAESVNALEGQPPSPLVRALADRVLRTRETVLVNGPDDLREFGPAEPGEEVFGDYLVAPAVMMDRFQGVVVLADKPGGFDDDDVETVLGVGDNAGVALQNEALQAELHHAYFSVVGVLADAMDVKDPYTKGHCALVSHLARLTAIRLAEDDTKLRSVCRYGGLLHDVGKIGVSDGVLNKPGKLSPEEWSLMQSHVRIGRDLLSKVPALDGVVDVILHHHERMDGTGYPDGLSGEAIPLSCRIVAVVDAYTAMTSKRSYKDSVSPEEARDELLRCRGTHFDPAVVEAFLDVLDADPLHTRPPGTELMPGLNYAEEFGYVLNRG